jgi:hypothetical protein
MTPRTSEQIQLEQRRVADTDRRQRQATKGPMPAGLTPLQQTQWRIWGWFDQRRRSKPSKYETRPKKGRVAPPVASTGTSATIEPEDYSNEHAF